MEAIARCVHYPYSHALVITTKITNSNVHRMLVNNGCVMDRLYLDAYMRMRLNKSDLRPCISLLYGFIGDHPIPRGTIKLVVIVGDQHRAFIVIKEFMMADFPSTFNGVIGGLILMALKAVTFIYHLRRSLNR